MMRKRTSKRALLGALCAAALAVGAGAAPAQGAVDPQFLFFPAPPPPSVPPKPITPPPTGYLNGPCGLAVDPLGRFYVSDYYHHAVDVFTPPASPFDQPAKYVTQIANVDPLGGPCGLALDSTNKVYVNGYNRSVTKFGSSPSFGLETVFPLPSEDTSHHLPTGIAVDTTTNRVYVNNRTYISVYDTAGNPIMDGLEPLKIGLGTLGDGYGVAISEFAGTAGRLYAPDADSNTVKVYDPTVSKTNPIAELKDPFNKPFISLKDSAIAIDNVTGDIYFADNTQPKYTERPQATIYTFGSTGIYKGHLKYNVLFGQPVGIAVDNSKEGTQGRIYVTTGNTDKGGVYAYAPPAGVFGAPLPPTFTLSLSTAGSGSGAVASAAAEMDCSSVCSEEMLAAEQLTFTATPDPGSEFAGWSGEACSGSDPTCTLTMTEATTLSAHFAELPTPQSPAAPQTTSPAAVTATTQRAQPNRKAKRRHRAKHYRHKAKHRHHRSAQRP